MTAAPRHAALTACALYVLCSALMASNVIFGRAAANIVPPVGLAFWRWLVAFLIILPMALPGLLAHRHTLRAAWKRYLLLGALGQGICGAVVYMGLEQTSATNAGLIYATSPVMIVMIAALWLGEKVTPRQTAGILVAMAGVLVILTRGDPQVLFRFAFNVGDLLVLVGAVAWAVYTVLLRQSRTSLPVVTAFAANALAGVIVLAPFYLWETLAFRTVPVSAEAAVRIIGVALFASVLAFITYQKTIATMGPARAGTTLYVMPLWAAVAAWALLGEALQAFHLAGLALVLPGVALATLPPRKPAPVTRSSEA
ncbi:DMT family transporter [Azospirillum soli]|uniref:DMT family transporter n=1 Tax=Azospirillum soli TaxID=1304799 RepID=UPI001AE16DFD|nr:DMT family transporter [Azospirillum soli]MBP2313840.1 drug/metabolite transporter (DMT)-like permease [Azospirillum soli]